MDNDTSKKVVGSLNNQIKKVQDILKQCKESDQIPIYFEHNMNNVVGVLSRCMVDIIGLDNIWTKDMSDYKKAVVMIERGFDFETRRNCEKEGIMINYLGYHLWDIEPHELEALKIMRNKRRANET